MPRTCTVCNNENAKKINKELMDGIPIRKIAEKYGVSTGAISRHKKNCVPGAAAKAIEAVKARKEKAEQKKAEKPTIADAAPLVQEDNQIMTGEQVLNKLHWLIGKAEQVIKDEEADAEKTDAKGKIIGTDRKVILAAIDRITKVTQTYVDFMSLAKEQESNLELQEWKKIGSIIWGFLEKKGLKEEFEAELSSHGL